MRSSRLPAVKRLTEFGSSFQPSLRHEQMESSTSSASLSGGKNVIFLGRSGVGKAHLAISLAIAAAQSGRRAYYGTLADLITSLEEVQAAGGLQERLKILPHPALLVVDEIGYLRISRTDVMPFFQLMTRRYEHASTVLTSDQGFEEVGRYSTTATSSRSAATATACASTRSSGRRCTRRRIRMPAPNADAAPVRRSRRSEARPLAELSDLQPAEVSDCGPR